MFWEDGRDEVEMEEHSDANCKMEEKVHEIPLHTLTGTLGSK